MTIRHKAVIRDQPQGVQFLNECVAAKLFDSRPFHIELKEFKSPQTRDQQAKFHVLCREYAQILKHEHGVDTDMEGVKEYLKDEYGPSVSYITPIGKVRARAMSSGDWNLKQTSQMIDHLKMDAANKGIDLE